MEKLSKSDFIVLSLYDLLETIGEDGFYNLISDFSCPYDKDIEDFLFHKSITFQRADYYSSRTYLIGFLGIDGNFKLCGYFSLVNKPFIISDNISKSKRKSITEGQIGKQAISAVMIGQFSKNYTSALNCTIDGSDLLSCAIETIGDVYKSIGLELVYLECKDNAKLRHFYENNGFSLYEDKNGNPIKTGKDSKYLCYIAKYKNLIIEK